MKGLKFRAQDSLGTFYEFSVFEILGLEETDDTKFYTSQSKMRLLCRTLEMSTGIRDIKGVEIFEGDIVQVPERLHMDEGGAVEYSHTGLFVMAQGSFKTSIHEMVYNNWKLEVIGNIHKNGDLLS